MNSKNINIGVIGCGYWGPNLIRNFNSLQNCTVMSVAETKPGRQEFIKKEFPGVFVTDNYKNILQDDSIDAVCIATPVKTHKDLAVESLNSGKHVFVEKPMAASSIEAEEMIKAAEANNKKLAVGYVFQFAPAVRAIKRLIDDGAIGKVFHVTSARINLGPPETDVDVIWDLGPHDFSILLYLLNEFPEEISSVNTFFPFGFSKNDSKKLINNSDIQMKFPSGTTAHVHLSWLSSNKTRLMQVFGSEGTIVYDEMLALDGKVKLFGKGIDNRINAKAGETKNLSYQAGEIRVIQLEQHEPLRLECEHFIGSILTNEELVNGPRIGLYVTKMLETVTQK
jgi:predicted dehydrogenase